MDSFWLYIKLGFEHVLDPNGLDHFLFLVVLALPYGWKQAKPLVGWVTLFTVGHTLALWAAYENWLTVDGKWVEFFIPITIGWMSINVLRQKKKAALNLNKQRSLMFITLLFGLIHGLGFGRYFSQIIYEEAAYAPLLQFAGRSAARLSDHDILLALRGRRFGSRNTQNLGAHLDIAGSGAHGGK